MGNWANWKAYIGTCKSSCSRKHSSKVITGMLQIFLYHVVLHYYYFIVYFQLYNNPNSSEDLKAKCNTALKQILQKCMYIEALESLLHDSPPNILKYVLGQFSKVRNTVFCFI